MKKIPGQPTILPMPEHNHDMIKVITARGGNKYASVSLDLHTRIVDTEMELDKKRKILELISGLGQLHMEECHAQYGAGFREGRTRRRLSCRQDGYGVLRDLSGTIRNMQECKAVTPYWNEAEEQALQMLIRSRDILTEILDDVK